MDPKHLYYLSVVLEKGSLTEAAKHLALTQPTLTRTMATLEMQAGTQLFSRSRYGVKGTPVGIALAREGRTINRSMEAARFHASRYRIGLDKEIRIGIGPLLSATIMPDAMHSLLELHPKASLTIEVSRPTAVIDHLIDNQLDIAIAPSATDKLIPGCNRELLFNDEIAIYCSHDHPLANKTDINIEDLATANWLSLGHGSPFEREVMELLNESGISKIRTQIVFRNEGYLLLETLRKGKHLAVLPNIPMQVFYQTKEFKRIELNRELSQPRNIYLWARDEMLETPIYKDIKSVMLAQAKTLIASTQ
ncbi:LysR family transcriptional regulator [Marinobacterium sp. xm-a-152]|jgi:DNA-binding transcriptional LysR family regulator|uniref:LysR family transcriptional regulator n=1 Tax=Marinobacterium sp. xm-a-152 TaxID=2497733 RepID=UPI0015697F1C|nr:LysR family transcriptional regulator [Marinobacterium sp. xm-a-152]NRP15901.1 HTH-type transcriptional regulator CysL [Marinobacterium sp. xm-a-152]